MDQLIILSAREFGREVYTWASQAEKQGAPWEVKGFLDENPDALAGYGYGDVILGNPHFYVPQPDDVFVVAIGSPVEKRRFVSLLESKGSRFGKIVHPTAVVGSRVKIGEGSIIGPLTQLSCEIEIGRHVVLGTNSNCGHDTRVGDFSQICGSCELNGHVQVGANVFVGSHATIVPGVAIGDGAYVGAGSVVLKRVQAGARVFGNPAVRFDQ